MYFVTRGGVSLAGLKKEQDTLARLAEKIGLCDKFDFQMRNFAACFLAGNVYLNVGFFQGLATNAKLQVSTTKR